MRDSREVTVSLRIGGDAAKNMRFPHPEECFVVEEMTWHGTIAQVAHHVCPLEKSCWADE